MVILGARIIILSMRDEAGYAVLEQADNSNMFREGYAWIVTEGITTYTAPRSDAARFEGLLGTAPSSPDGQAAQALFGKENPQVGRSTRHCTLLPKWQGRPGTVWQ